MPYLENEKLSPLEEVRDPSIAIGDPDIISQTPKSLGMAICL